MDHKLSVLVRIDIDSAAAVLVVRGCLTYANVQALLVLIRRAENLSFGLSVAVDLAGTLHVDAQAVEQLKSSVAADVTVSSAAEGFKRISAAA